MNGTLYVSGQLGIDPKTSELVSGGVEEQARQALQNMGAILKAAGADYGNGKKAFTVLKSCLLCISYVNFSGQDDSSFGGYQSFRTSQQRLQRM